MKSTTSLKDFKELSSLKGNKKSLHPHAFDLDGDDPELDLNTWKNVELNQKWEGRNKLQPNEMSVRFQTPSSTRKRRNIARDTIVEATEIYLRFGPKVIKSLGWRAGEHVAVFQHPQDKSVDGLMPKPTGRKLREEARGNGTIYMAFAFKNDSKILTQNSRVVEYSIHENGYLLFRLPPQEQV